MARVIIHEGFLYDTPQKYEKPFMIGPSQMELQRRERVKQNYKNDLWKQVEEERTWKEKDEESRKKLDMMDEMRVRKELQELNERYMGKQPWQRIRSVETPVKSGRHPKIKWKLLFEDHDQSVKPIWVADVTKPVQKDPIIIDDPQFA